MGNPSRDRFRNTKSRSILLTASLFGLITGVQGNAVAENWTHIAALRSPLPPAEAFEAAHRRSPDPAPGRAAESSPPSKNRRSAPKPIRPSHGGNGVLIEKTPRALADLRPPEDPAAHPDRAGPVRPLLGLKWKPDTPGPNRWNVVFGVGIVISRHGDLRQLHEGLGSEKPTSDRDQVELFEKLVNTMQAVGFQFQYDF